LGGEYVKDECLASFQEESWRGTRIRQPEKSASLSLLAHRYNLVTQFVGTQVQKTLRMLFLSELALHFS